MARNQRAREARSLTVSLLGTDGTVGVRGTRQMKTAEYSCAMEFGELTCGQGEVVCHCDSGSSGFSSLLLEGQWGIEVA